MSPFAPALLASAALALFVPTPARASSPCRPHRGDLSGSREGRIWHARGSLFGCVFDGTHVVRRRLGPWSPGSRVAWDGTDAAWSVPQPGGDRLWATAVGERAWLRGARALPGGGGRVQKLLVGVGAAAWVTRSSEAVLALDAPADDPTPVGALPAPLVFDATRVLVGRWPQVPAAALAATVKLTSGDGEGDECGGTTPFRLTLRPDPAAAPVGARWTRTWATEDC
jgi:hypothetical protein